MLLLLTEILHSDLSQYTYCMCSDVFLPPLAAYSGYLYAEQTAVSSKPGGGGGGPCFVVTTLIGCCGIFRVSCASGGSLCLSKLCSAASPWEFSHVDGFLALQKCITHPASREQLGYSIPAVPPRPRKLCSQYPCVLLPATLPGLASQVSNIHGLSFQAYPFRRRITPFEQSKQESIVCLLIDSRDIVANVSWNGY